jgi:hypothetical protein
MVVAFALLFLAEGALLPTAWLPAEEAATLARARGQWSAHSAEGLLYRVLLEPAARSLSPWRSFELARALSAVLCALTAVPAYLLARRLVPAGASLVVAGLSVLAAGSVYATAAVPDSLALLLAVSSLPLLARASDRGSMRDLLCAIALAIAAALARPWLVVLPPALLVAYELPRSRKSFLLWPRSLVFAGLAAFAYLVVATTAPAAGSGLASPGEAARAAAASLAVVAVGAGVVPWLLAASGWRRATARPETALLAACLPALLLAAGVFGAAGGASGVEERPLLVLVPLVLALAASAWLDGDVRLRPAVVAGAVVVLAALALPGLGRVAVSHAAGLSLVARRGGSRTGLAAGAAAAVAIALVLLAVLRGRGRGRLVLPAALALVLVAGHALAWSSVHAEARALAAGAPGPRGWVDRHAGKGADVVVAGPAGAVGEPAVDELTLWNRSVSGVRALDLASADPKTGLLPVSGADVVLERGVDLAGTEVARSAAGVLLRGAAPLQLAETTEGLYADGWSGAYTTYRRFTGPSRPGSVLVTVSRAAWGGPDRPGGVSILTGPLDGNATTKAHVVIHAGRERKVAVPVPAPPFQVVVSVNPTFSPADFGSSDTRQLGAQLRFAYRPSRRAGG